MLKEDLLILKKYFRRALDQTQENPFCNGFIKKKYKHSIDVLRFGKNIFQNEPSLQKRGTVFSRMADTALVLHDVGRFSEIVHLYHNNLEKDNHSWLNHKYDHGVFSSQIIKEERPDCSPALQLALKHHGHMIEDFYEDELYKQLSHNEKDVAEALIFLVRDADKIANLFIQKYHNNLEKEAFYQNMDDKTKYGTLSEPVLQSFQQEKVIKNNMITSYSDRLVAILSWLFDLNFPASIQLYKQENYADWLLERLQKYNQESAKQGIIKDCLYNRLAQFPD